jgi:hypothetical protein
MAVSPEVVAMSILPTLVLLASLPAGLGAHQAPPREPGGCCGQGRSQGQERQARAAARQVAEAATGGRAVAFTRVRINGSTVWGFEVRVHMPGKARGWRCLVDMDFPPKLYNKYEIPNPPPPRAGAGD